MAKGFAAPSDSDPIVKTSFRVPKKLPGAIRDHFELIDLSIKKRTEWIIEISERFIQQSDAALIVAEEFTVRGETDLIPLRARQTFLDKMDQAARFFSEQANVDIDRSSILRTAIMQAIISGTRDAFDPADVQKLKEENDD